MLFEFAVDPAVLTTWDKCRNTLNLMGFQHARAIAAYPSKKRWKKMVLEACRRAGCADREFARILEKIRQADSKLVWSGRPFDDSVNPEDERWIRNAAAQQETDDPFHAILAVRNPNGHADVVLEEEIDEAHPKLAVARETPVLREADPFAGHIRTLIRNSRELLLIDPHFDPSFYRWRSVVQACLTLAARGADGQPLDAVEIHAVDDDEKPSFVEYERRCRTHLPGMLPAGLRSIRVVRWRMRPAAPDDFHGRYVLTDRGGYRLDKGLDEEFGKEQPVGLLADAEWQRLWNGFRGENQFFEKDGEFEVP